MTNEDKADVMWRALREETRPHLHHVLAVARNSGDEDAAKRARLALGLQPSFTDGNGTDAQELAARLEAMSWCCAIISGEAVTHTMWSTWAERYERAMEGLKLLLGHDPRDEEAARVASAPTRALRIERSALTDAMAFTRVYLEEKAHVHRFKVGDRMFQEGAGAIRVDMVDDEVGMVGSLQRCGSRWNIGAEVEVLAPEDLTPEGHTDA